MDEIVLTCVVVIGFALNALFLPVMLEIALHASNDHCWLQCA